MAEWRSIRKERSDLVLFVIGFADLGENVLEMRS
jgi:hypothetical protein